MATRIPLEETFLNIAIEWSQRSTCSSRIAVGAVIVNDRNQIIASGYNGSPRGFSHCNDVGCMKDELGHCIRAIHAETNAIIQCAQNGVSTIGTRMFVTHSPCFYCTKLIIQSGIIEVQFIEGYKDLLKVLDFFNEAHVRIYQHSMIKE